MRFASFAFLAALAATAQQRPVTLDDMHKLKTVGDPRYSPDAK